MKISQKGFIVNDIRQDCDSCVVILYSKHKKMRIAMDINKHVGLSVYVSIKALKNKNNKVYYYNSTNDTNIPNKYREIVENYIVLFKLTLEGGMSNDYI